MLAVMALEAHGLHAEGGRSAGHAARQAESARPRSRSSRSCGFQVVASTGRAETHEYLKSLGAATVIDRSPFAEPAKRPLEGERWAGCIDAVGGNTLARILAQTSTAGSVAAVGLAGGSKLRAHGHSVSAARE